MSENILKDLFTLLEKEIELYKHLFLVAKKKQTALFEGKLAEIEEFTKTEQILLLQVGKVEEGRQSLHLQLANYFSMPVGELTISKLAEKVEEPWIGKISRMEEDFILVLGELKIINESNSGLIKQSLDFINFSINLVAGSDSGLTYPNKGDKTASGAKLFDKKI